MKLNRRDFLKTATISTAGVVLASGSEKSYGQEEFPKVENVNYQDIRSGELTIQQVSINDKFWDPRLMLNREKAIFHQWEQLEKTGAIDNFRITAGQKPGKHQGMFYSDSDAYKWAEAASNILASNRIPRLEKILTSFAELVRDTQESDGYIFTYNQLGFPGKRWVNLQVEHELYSLGHLIEAGIAMDQALQDRTLLSAAILTADLLVRDFADSGPSETPGHPGVELALMRLYRYTDNKTYRDLAIRFVENRGRAPLPGLRLAAQGLYQLHRNRVVARQKKKMPGSGSVEKSSIPFINGKMIHSFLSGEYQQQHKPVRKMKKPVGHAVRWSYLACAATMIARDTGDMGWLNTIDQSWRHMVSRRMYVTGGLGALPVIEGFGKDYQLDNSTAYCETCAALASIFWSHEMLGATGEAAFADLIEWQLHNASAVSVGKNGQSYFYNNPLKANGNMARESWYNTPCCPSNISRVWASLGRYLYDYDADNLWIHQYLTNDVDLPKAGAGVSLRVNSELPWSSKVVIELDAKVLTNFTLRLRIPSWTEKPSLKVNSQDVAIPSKPQPKYEAASGYTPFTSFYVSISREWVGHNRIELDLPMPIISHRAHHRVTNNRGCVSISRGPIVYCLEGYDNPEANVPNAVIARDAKFTEIFSSELLGGVVQLETKSKSGKPLRLVPYYAWANRDESKMQVWIRKEK